MKTRTKLFLSFLVISIIPLLVVGIFYYYLIADRVTRQNEENLSNITQGIYNMVDTQQKVLTLWLASSAGFFAEKLGKLGESSFDETDIITFRDYQIPAWYIGGQKITNDNTLVDTLIADQNLAATLFQFHDNKFLRVSSNVRQDGGLRIVGTKIESGPIYDKLINGQTYQGRGNVEGIMHAIIYQPIFDKSKRLIGAFVLGVREQEYELINAIRNFRVAQSGYVSVMDPNGVFIIHPTKQGQDALANAWANEVLKQKNGFMTYQDELGQKKIAYYTYYEPWDWYIITSGYVSEIYSITTYLFQGLLLICCMAILVAIIIAYYLSQSFSRPILEWVRVMRLVQGGDLTARLNNVSGSEHQSVALALNEMLDNITLMIKRISNSSSQLQEASENLLTDIHESDEALGSIEVNIEQLQASLASVKNDSANSLSVQELLDAISKVYLAISMLQENMTSQSSNVSFQDLTHAVEVLRQKLLVQSILDHQMDLPVHLQNQIHNLGIELTKLKLLTKHIHGSASRLDDIALSLDHNANTFKTSGDEL